MRRKSTLINTMNSELKNFYDNKIMVFKKHLPQGAYPTSIKQVYTIKRDKKDNIKKYKARLVVIGFT